MESFSGMWFIYLSPHTQGIIVPQARVKACKLLLPPCWKIDCLSLKQATMATMSLWEHWTCPVRKTRFWPDPPWTLSLTMMVPEPGEMGYRCLIYGQILHRRFLSALVRCEFLHYLHTEQRRFFLMRVDSCTNVWVLRHKSRVQLDTMSI